MIKMQTRIELTLIIIIINVLFDEIRGQFLHEFHVKENSMTYKSILNLRELLIDKNKIDPVKPTSDYKIYISHVINKGLFRLDAESNLRVSKLIDREELCSSKQLKQSAKLCGSIETCCHILEFQVSFNNNKEVHSYYLRVFIDDENDITPRFPSFSIPYANIPENKPLGYRIKLPKALDLDNSTFGIAYYKIIKPFILGNSSSFELGYDSKNSDPHLIISSVLDREKIEIYKFYLIAVDGIERGVRNTGTTEVIINIQDVNDNPPEFNKHVYIATVQENRIIDPIFDITVTDHDKNTNADLKLRLEFENQQDYSRLFVLDVISKRIGQIKAQLRTITNLDYDNSRTNLFEFFIVAEDYGTPVLTSKSAVRIQLTNFNDEKPKVTFVRHGKMIKSGFDIDENIPSQSVLGEIHVQDIDSPTDQLQCDLKTFNQIFSLTLSLLKHPINLYKKYIFKTISRIDREEIMYQSSNDNNIINDKLLVVIECCDYESFNSLCTNATVFIAINDLNDNPPVFANSKYYGNLLENLINREIEFEPKIIVRDKDIGDNARLDFFLEDFANSTDSINFKINSINGIIVNRISFDYETKKLYSFLICVRDFGHPIKLSSSATVLINIKDDNDNAPLFTKSHYSFEIKENVKIGSLIGEVKAIDDDTTNENRQIRYFIKLNNEISNQGADLVNIDSVSGQIRTSQMIDREKINAITFFVGAKNPVKLKKGLLQEVMVVIKILNENDCPPRFRLIDEKKSRIVISLELLEQGQVCEPIPYLVDDPDFEGNGLGGNCCEMRLRHDYNGLISFSKESHSVICVNKIPKKMNSIHVTVIAKDNHDNKSLETEKSFMILLRHDPTYSMNKNIFNRDSKSSQTQNQMHNPTGHQGNNDNNRQNNLFTEDEINQPNDFRQIILIGALASLAGLFIVSIVLILLFGTQRKCDIFNLTLDSNDHAIEDESVKIQHLNASSTLAMRSDHYLHNSHNNNNNNNQSDLSSNSYLDRKFYKTCSDSNDKKHHQASTINIYNALNTLPLQQTPLLSNNDNINLSSGNHDYIIPHCNLYQSTTAPENNNNHNNNGTYQQLNNTATPHQTHKSTHIMTSCLPNVVSFHSNNNINNNNNHTSNSSLESSTLNMINLNYPHNNNHGNFNNNNNNTSYPNNKSNNQTSFV